MVQSVGPRTLSQQDDMFFSAESLIVVFLHPWLLGGLDYRLLFIVSEAGFKLFFLCTLFWKFKGLKKELKVLKEGLCLIGGTTVALIWHDWRELNIVAVTEFLRKFMFGNFQIFVVSDQGKCALSIGTIPFFIGYMENAKCQPNQNCVACSNIKLCGNLSILV